MVRQNRPRFSTAALEGETAREVARDPLSSGTPTHATSDRDHVSEDDGAKLAVASFRRRSTGAIFGPWRRIRRGLTRFTRRHTAGRRSMQRERGRLVPRAGVPQFARLRPQVDVSTGSPRGACALHRARCVACQMKSSSVSKRRRRAQPRPRRDLGRYQRTGELDPLFRRSMIQRALCLTRMGKHEMAASIATCIDNAPPDSD